MLELEEEIAGRPAHAWPGAPRPFMPRAGVRLLDVLHQALAPNRAWYAAALWLEQTPVAYRAFTWLEERIKRRLFGCRMCGQCALPSTAYACPMTCPKQLRNGPCGGVSPNGDCEVYPGLRCVWLAAHERAEREGRLAIIKRLHLPIDHRKWQQSSWVNFWLGRDQEQWETGR